MSDAFWGAFIPGMVAIILAIIGLAKLLIDNAALKRDVNAVHTVIDGQKTGMQQELDGLRQLIMQSMADKKAVPVAGVIEVDKAKAVTIAKAVAAAEVGASSPPVSAPPPPSRPMH